MRNPSLDFVRSLYPRSAEPVRDAHGWVGLLNHDLEAPDRPGMARSLAEGWFRSPSNETSVHAIVDRGEVVQSYEFLDKVWGCGTGNDYVIVQTEHVGYASWSAAQWRTPTMRQVIANSARHQAWCWFHLAMQMHDITYYPEWLSLTQIAAQSRSGLLTHNDARLVWGGTTHTDPGPHFPYQELRNAIHAELDRLTGKEAKPVPAKTYTVRVGDTLSGIGQRTGVSWKRIADLNGISDPYIIYPGQVLSLSAKETSMSDAERTLQQLQAKTGLSNAAIEHIETSYHNIGKTDHDPDLQVAVSRYLELLAGVNGGKGVSNAAFQHVLTAYRRVHS